jgi:hypothetical protein
MYESDDLKDIKDQINESQGGDWSEVFKDFANHIRILY